MKLSKLGETEISPACHSLSFGTSPNSSASKLENIARGADLRDNGRRELPFEEKYMRRAISVFGALLLVLTFAMAAFAQDSGRVNGEILDKEGKPYADVTFSLKNQDTGQVYTAKTDKNGKFTQLGMRGGIYTVTSTNAKDGFTFSEKMLVSTEKDNDYKLSVKEVLAQQGPSAEEQKKQAEQAEKFKNMKAHFDAGIAAMTAANDLKTQLRTASADQKSA